ncbi:hypothetical protein [Microbulbifer marinus]|uniref:Sulfotransferase domain-containing protein n=1 Tax=Microbulbifer marinus TaxID=658218 RepID=A0A1H3VX65_9GAMM|nr:hypothetical protein [Microbulbifer marinus]SDZ78804.1 hypothetical protein SAMN05216562_0310 [Microbulbifer marinus]
MLSRLIGKIKKAGDCSVNRNIYIHIGISKTGTTAIQKFFHKNSEMLASKGFHYVRGGRAEGGACHHHLARLYKSGNARREDVLALRDEMAQSDSHSFIISSEMFEYLGPSQIKQLKRDFEGYTLILVVYLRYQDQALSSMYNELVKKHACATSFSEHVRETPRKGLLLYGKMLKQWEKEFGRNNIRVRVYDRERLRGGNVIEDMCVTIGMDVRDINIPDSSANPSISAAAIHLLRDINSHMDYSIDHAEHYGLACKLAFTLDKLIRNEFPCFDHNASSYFPSCGEYDELMEYYRRDNLRISRRYLSGEGFSEREFSSAKELTDGSKRDVLIALAEKLGIPRDCDKMEVAALTRLIAEFWSGELRRLCKS